MPVFTRKRIKELLPIMEHYANGGDVESRRYLNSSGEWFKPQTPTWAGELEYRIAKTPDSINWDHVSDEFNCMVTNKQGGTILYPRIAKVHRIDPHTASWSCSGAAHRYAFAIDYASFVKGNMYWEDSLVVRPGYSE